MAVHLEKSLFFTNVLRSADWHVAAARGQRRIKSSVPLVKYSLMKLELGLHETTFGNMSGSENVFVISARCIGGANVVLTSLTREAPAPIGLSPNYWQMLPASPMKAHSIIPDDCT